MKGLFDEIFVTSNRKFQQTRYHENSKELLFRERSNERRAASGIIVTKIP
jgi:hypothetical protein